MRAVERRDRNENVLQGPMDYAKTMTLRICERDVDLPERRKTYVYQ